MPSTAIHYTVFNKIYQNVQAPVKHGHSYTQSNIQTHTHKNKHTHLQAHSTLMHGHIYQ